MDSIIIFCAKYLFVAVVLLVGLLWLKLNRKDKIGLFLAVAIAGVIALVLDKIAGKLYFDPRPFVTHNIKPLVAHVADNGFPSEHALFTATISAAAYFYNRKVGLAAFALAVVVGAGRVAAHVHSPIDIIGGLVMGLVAGAGGFYLAKRFYPSNKQS